MIENIHQLVGLGGQMWTSSKSTDTKFSFREMAPSVLCFNQPSALNQDISQLCISINWQPAEEREAQSCFFIRELQSLKMPGFYIGASAPFCTCAMHVGVMAKSCTRSP
jgi:hypothetical protein